MRIVAFLRAINVGGRNKVAMSELRDLLSAAGFEGVSTYVQTGNILLSHTGDLPALSDRLEGLLESHFGFPIPVIIRTADELQEILQEAPFDPDDDDLSHQFVALLRDPLEGDLPNDAPDGSCRYLLKREREVYSQWWKIDGEYRIPKTPKNLSAATLRNRRVLTAILAQLRGP